MSILNIAFPATAAVPMAEVAISSIVASVRPLLGLGLFATMFVVFKPLLTGIAQALKLIVAPKKTREEKTAIRNLRNALTIRRIANDFDRSSPNMAAELRALAARG
ncbi:hypothetical protein ACO0K0_14140 [Undibacterium sp. SXout11W]|uniref:hypothetical protein n=1 Tax=Undibacterium sp. SXout11W TaxID=3413050 RepID=UPI003BF35B92